LGWPGVFLSYWVGIGFLVGAGFLFMPRGRVRFFGGCGVFVYPPGLVLAFWWVRGWVRGFLFIPRGWLRFFLAKVGKVAWMGFVAEEFCFCGVFSGL